MPELAPVTWEYQTVVQTSSKEARRAGTARGVAHELIGVDASLEGGLRPFPGFREYTELDYGWGSTYRAGGELQDWYPFTVRIDDTTYAYGFLYRVLNSTSTQCTYRFKIRIGESATWCYDVDFGYPSGLVVEDYAGERMWVEAIGRFLYVGRSGLAPFMFYFKAIEQGSSSSSSSSSSSVAGSPCSDYEVVLVTDPGPGPELLLQNPASGSNYCCVRSRDDLPGEPHPDMQEVITELAIPVGEEDAVANLIYFGFSDLRAVQASTQTDPEETNPFISERNPAPIGGNPGRAVRGPSDLKFADDSDFWAVPPFPDPTFRTTIPRDSTGAPVVPGYALPTPAGEYNGSRYDIGARDVDGEEPVGVSAEQYIWAYRLLDSRTGRMSSLSARLSSDGTEAGAAWLSGQQQTYGGQVVFPMLLVTYNSAKYDTMLLYRGRRPYGVTTADETILSLDSVWTLADYLVDKQPATAGWSRAAVFAQLDNETLALQETIQPGEDSYLPDMPTFGSALYYEGLLVVGDLGAFDLEDNGVSEIKWSSPYTVSVEQFDPTDRYFLKQPSEEVLRFEQAGMNAFGFSRERVYAFRRETLNFKAYPLHFGYGLISRNAASEVGSTIYYLTERGVKALIGDGQLDDVASFNKLIIDEWEGNLSNVSMAFDGAMGALFMHNPDLERTAVFWMNTSALTEIYDTPFFLMREGDMPEDPTSGVGASNPLRNRALGVYTAQVSATAYVYRVVAADYRRERTGGGLGTTVRLLPFSGSSRFTLSAEQTAGSSLIQTPAGYVSASNASGTYLYVMNGDYAGTKFKVQRASLLGSIRFHLEENLPVTLPAGTRIGVSPVYYRTTFDPVPLSIEGQQFGPPISFRTRQVNQIGCLFTAVAGNPTSDGSTDARFRAGVYRGNKSTAEATAWPVGSNGNAIVSISEGSSPVLAAFELEGGGVEGPVLSPFIEVFCPDLDFQMLGVRVDGRIGATRHTTIPVTAVPT